MYSRQLQDQLSSVGQIGDVDPASIKLLDRSMSAYLKVLAGYLNADMNPNSDPLLITLDALFISRALSMMELSPLVESGHYLVGMAFEQSGELLSRKYLTTEQGSTEPLKNDLWYRLLLSFLHYLAGGHRVQALSILNRLDGFKKIVLNTPYAGSYEQATDSLRRLFNGKTVAHPVNYWEQLFFRNPEGISTQEGKINRLASQVRTRRQEALSDLGLENASEWLIRQGVRENEAPAFWEAYLQNLEQRGITNFTSEQRGPNGFQDWLQIDRDLLVILPTGSGKSIIGELRTALTLAKGKQVVWLLPSRALVRQAHRELTKAFEILNVSVEELPTTEDFEPFFIEDLPAGRYVAATTPEKLAALIRANPDSMRNVGLVILDEAQKLFDLKRGTTIEYVLQEIQHLLPIAKFVLMSAQIDSMIRLQNFFHRLRGDRDFRELISDRRPTRRMYGVITNAIEDHFWKPELQIYPPGLQNEDGVTESPFRISLQKHIRSTNPNSMDIVQPLVLKLTETPLRTAVFVRTPINTETQSERIASKIDTVRELPHSDLARLRIELGRESVILTYGGKGIAPHHAGLTPLEQHTVEKWERRREINTVVATSTLAEGVNLPIDISIITYTTRYDNGQWVDVPLNEIQNMVGRAGRAGHVSDGLCLIALTSNRRNPIMVDSARRYFFRQERIQNFLGLSRLLIKAIQTHASEEEWLYEYDGLDFSECQTLVNFVTNIGLDPNHFDNRLREKLRQYPSIQDLQEYFGDGLDVLAALNHDLIPIAERITNICENDPNLYLALSRTGIPLELLQYYLTRLDERERLIGQDDAGIMIWADNVVQNGFLLCQNRAWYRNIFDRVSQNDLMAVIQLWRNGIPIQSIENQLVLSENPRQSRINVGRLLNHQLSMFAQFWGALSICEKIKYPDRDDYMLNNIQVYVREGVSTLKQLAWLNRLGGIDRVLAHRLERYTPEGEGLWEISRQIDQTFRRWRRDHASLPMDLELDELAALNSIFEE